MTANPPLPKARLEALTDGIFAVTMTLLVLDLKFPEPSPTATVGEEFLVLLDRIDNYAISFVVLAVFWLGHLRLMRRLHETDAVFVALNLAFLLFTTLVPPLTDLLGDHPELPRAAVLYGGDLVLIIACEAAMWRRVCTRLANDTLADPQATWRTVSHRYAVALGIVLAGIGAALVEIAIGRSADVAPWVYLLLLAAGVMRPALRTARRS